MTVKELIENLEKCDPDRKVIFNVDYGYDGSLTEYDVEGVIEVTLYDEDCKTEEACAEIIYK